MTHPTGNGSGTAGVEAGVWVGGCCVVLVWLFVFGVDVGLFTGLALLDC